MTDTTLTIAGKSIDTAPEHLATGLPGVGPDPYADDLLRFRVGEGDNSTIGKLRLRDLAEFMHRSRAERGING